MVTLQEYSCNWFRVEGTVHGATGTNVFDGMLRVSVAQTLLSI